MKQEVKAAGVTRPLGAYSQAIRAGDFVFISGEGPLDEEGNLVGKDIQEQTRATMRNLAAILDAAGLSFADVVKATVYLRSMDDYTKFNEAYRKFLSRPFPARVCTAAGALFGELLVEIDMVAYAPSGAPA